ncbi:Innexin inx2 [Daphnia magna]|uniref:Innexin n=1 Tax=Daphnia magna TaxID=35525 RepID=A0A0P5ZCT8_9CRUS|nr:Innexin inx2 [Daphnia magna]
MLPDLISLQGLFKIDPIKTDNNIFRCHYKLTVIFLALSATLVSLNQYVGDPIDCFINAEKSPFPNKVLDNYCWIHSTHTLPNQPGIKGEGSMPIPGLGTPKEGEKMIYHKYYQWVGFFLLFQAITFYLPRFFWKFWEAGRMKAIVEDLSSSIMPSDVEEQAKHNLVDYLLVNVNQHQAYAVSFFVCEVLNAINIVGEIFLVDKFLGGEFTEYGGNVLTQTGMNPEDRTDPMSYVFPKVTKCLFKMYGPSGTVQQFDAYCVLPVNILNEKIFIFLWFWYIILAVVTGLGLLYRIFTLVLPKLRLFLLQRRAGRDFDSSQTETVFRRCQIGDWFVLMLVSSNVNQWIFQEVIDELAKKFRGKDI